ncbi:MAG: sulfatase-like hydrolase/transferase [Planctomycetaceae bacterium]
MKTKSIAAVIVLTFGLLAGRPVVGAESKPNLLFIFADDQAYHTIHSAGNDEIQTPHLDRLFQKGTHFTHAYNMGGWNGAICMASRAMLNTGRFLWHAHQVDPTLKSQWVPKKKLWSQQLAAAGYQTFFSGKWHVGVNANDVFEVARNVRGGMPNQTDAGYNRPKSPDDHEWIPWDTKLDGFWKGGKHWSEVLGDDGVEYLKMAAGDERPFFMYLAFNAPHDPRQSPKEFVDRYPLDGISVPASYQPEYPFQIGSNRIRDEQLAPFPRTEYAVKVNRQEYYAIITHMDQQIGRILDALDSSGQADNTWVFFTADHGLACGNHGLMGKQNMFDHSLRVPFVVCDPGKTAPSQISQRIYLQSVMPTTLELAGVPIPDDIEFSSLLPLMKAADPVQPSDPDGTIYGAYVDTQRAIISGDHKLILYPKISTSLLYNLKEDPDELKEQSGTSEALSIKRRLFREFLTQQKLMGDTLDVTSRFPDLAE